MAEAKSMKKVAFGLEENSASALAYVLWWMSGLIFILAEKDSGKVRFHAMQSLMFFGGLQILMMLPVVGWILFPFLMILGLVVWLMSIYKAYQGEEFELPVVGKMAKQQLKKIK